MVGALLIIFTENFSRVQSVTKFFLHIFLPFFLLVNDHKRKQKVLGPNQKLKFNPTELIIYCKDFRIVRFRFDESGPESAKKVNIVKFLSISAFFTIFTSFFGVLKFSCLLCSVLARIWKLSSIFLNKAEAKYFSSCFFFIINLQLL